MKRSFCRPAGVPRVRVLFVLLCIPAIFDLFCQTAEADLNVVREVTIAPKNGRVAANIGSVNQSYNIRMEKALVEITVGRVPDRENDPVMIRVAAQHLARVESRLLPELPT